MKMIKAIKWESVVKILMLLAIATICCVYASHVFAQEDVKTITALHKQVTEHTGAIIKLMFAVAYIAGFGFVIAAIFKFKQHKDNPTQIPMGTPIAMLVIGIALIFLPNIIAPAGYSLFGESATVGGTGGGGVEQAAIWSEE